MTVDLALRKRNAHILQLVLNYATFDFYKVYKRANKRVV